MPILTINNLTYIFDDGTRALENISLEIKKGEFIGLLASNGGGKTTLLKTIVGLYKPSSGHIFFENTDIRKIKRIELSRRIGLVFQNPNDQLFASTVEEDVAFGPRNLGLAEKDVTDRVSEALHMVDLDNYAKKPIHHLSFGQQKRACIAGVLAMKPEIILLDEPTAGLDPKSESHLLQILSKLNRENNSTIIMATHMVDLMPLFVDRIYVLKDGRISLEGSPEEVFSSTQVMEEVNLRLPYVTHLIEELKHKDRIPLDEELPLTIKDARSKLVALIK